VRLHNEGIGLGLAVATKAKGGVENMGDATAAGCLYGELVDLCCLAHTYDVGWAEEGYLDPVVMADAGV